MANILGGRSLVSIGLAAPFVLGAAPNPVPVEFVILEPGTLGVLALPQGVGRFLTSLRIRGQEMISGIVPFSLFASDNPSNPVLGYAVDESSRIFFNAQDAAGSSVLPTISSLRTLSIEIDGMTHKQAVDEEINLFGRAPGLQLAIGPAAQTAALVAGATVVQRMVINRPGRLGYLTISPEIEGLDVVGVDIQNDGLVNGQSANELWNAGSFGSPGFGHSIVTSTVINVTIRNNSALAITDVCAAFSMLDSGVKLASLMDLRQSVAANPGALNLEG